MPSAHDNPTIDPGPDPGHGHGHGHDPSVGPDTPTLAGPPSSLILTDLIAAENGAIGPYRLLSVIGEGGFGVVYLAEQSQPIARRVALKVVKPGMDSRAVLQRFEQERQALAIIDHPNVARVLDAGVTQRARPYFVMEHVAGEPITAYCDRHKLSTRQRLELFIPVCEAVHHAHSKGIIHRDLKPSNILVALIGQRPVPKVIDFGVAKALHGRTAGAADAPAYTEVGQIVGTPEYMSPEQAEMNALDIDTRTDVYALGVVLYELLTGVLPLDSSHIRRLSLVEMQRIIREVDPPRPSTRLSTLADGDALAIAQRRRAEPRALARELSRELEWIPLKAMRKDRTERYRSAVELADDIRNYLERRPLLAGPESARYRLRKYLRRHALPVAAGGAIVLALAGGLIATSLALAEAHEANRRAEELRTQLLQVQNQLLASQSPEAVGVTAALPDADRLAPDPARAANAGPAPAEAAAPSKTTVEADPRPDADDRLADAEATQRRIVELSIATLGPDHPDTVASRTNLARLLIKRGRADEAEPALRAALTARQRTAGPNAPGTVAVAADLGTLLNQAGRAAEAEPVLREALKGSTVAHGPDANQTLSITGELARCLRAQQKFAEAADLLGRVADGRARPAGPEHPAALVAGAAYGAALRDAGRLDDAATRLNGVLDSMRRVFGDEHPVTLGCFRDLALTYAAQKKYDRAEPILLEMHRRAAARYGAASRIAHAIAADLAAVYTQMGRSDDAAAWDAESRPRAGPPRPGK